MGIIRCQKGLHFYDDMKYDTCPHCEQNQERISRNTIQEQMTVAMQPEQIPEVQEFVLRSGNQKIIANDLERTVGYFSPVRGNDFVTGWLVCIQGPEKGRDYRLHHGFNRVGRSMNMDIFVTDDPAISRETHCSIVYDAKSNRFYAVPGKGTLTYVNQDLLECQQTLHAGDRLQLGESCFEFIAYCREGHTWEEEK